MRWRRTAAAGLVLLLVSGLIGAAPVTGKPKLEWKTLAPSLTPRTEAAAAVLDGEIYLMGGYAPPAVSVPVVEIYNPEQDAWRPGPPLPLPVNHAAAATVGDEIFVFGGYLGYALGSQFSPIALPTERSFVLRSGVWEEIAPLPEARAAGGAAAIGSKVYIVGGVLADGSNATSTLVYDTRSDTWKEIKGLRYNRQHLGVTGAGGRAFAVGGRYDLLNSNVPLFEQLDPRTGRWEALPVMPTARGGLGAAFTRNDHIVAVGGEGMDGTFAQAEAYSLKRKRWISLPPLPTARHGLGVVAIGNVVYAIGGGTEPSYSYSSVNEALDLGAL